MFVERIFKIEGVKVEKLEASHYRIRILRKHLKRVQPEIALAFYKNFEKIRLLQRVTAMREIQLTILFLNFDEVERRSIRRT